MQQFLTKEQYNFILEYAELVRYIYKDCSMASFKIRNEWIIDQSYRVIAVNSGDFGDTRNTVEYAKKDIDAIINQTHRKTLG